MATNCSGSLPATTSEQRSRPCYVVTPQYVMCALTHVRDTVMLYTGLVLGLLVVPVPPTFSPFGKWARTY